MVSHVHRSKDLSSDGNAAQCGFTDLIQSLSNFQVVFFPELEKFTLNLPHVDMEGIILVDFKASGPNTIGNIHQSDT